MFEGLAASLSSLLGLAAIGGVGKVVWGAPILLALIALVVTAPSSPASGPRRASGRSPRRPPSTGSSPPSTTSPAARRTRAATCTPAALFSCCWRPSCCGACASAGAALLVGGAVTAVALVPQPGAAAATARTGCANRPCSPAPTWRGSKSPTAPSTPASALTPEIAGTPSLVDVDAGEYLAMAAEYGSPAYTPAELVAAPHSRPPPGRRRARPGAAGEDRDPAWAERPGPATAALEVAPGPSQPEIRLGPGPDEDRRAARRTAAAISLRRFAGGEYPVVPEARGAADSTTLLAIPARRAVASPGSCTSKRRSGGPAYCVANERARPYSSSAIRGASRLKIQTPKTQTRDEDRRRRDQRPAAPPAASTAVGAVRVRGPRPGPARRSPPAG